MSTPPIFLFQTEFEAMGGAERSLLALSRWLVEQNQPHKLLTYVDHCNIAAHAYCPVIELKPAMNARAKVATLKHFFATEPRTGVPLLSGYQSAMHASLAGLRGTHCLMHDTPDLFEGHLSIRQRIRRFISNRIVARNLAFGGHTIVTSEHLQREVRRVFHVHADIARMGGLITSAFTPRRVNKQLRMISVSRLENNKRLDWVLRALASLEHAATPLSTRVDWHFDILGKGSQLESLRQLAGKLDLTTRVTFHGYVSDADLELLYESTHLFLMPAVQGYGIPAVEALSRGIPVLLHRDSGVSDILLDTPWATVLEGNEENLVPALAHAIDNLIRGAHLATPLPYIPTENEWASQVAALCGWVG